MKLLCVFLALLSAVFIGNVVGHNVCNYRQARLSIARDAEACEENCKNCKMALPSRSLL